MPSPIRRTLCAVLLSACAAMAIAGAAAAEPAPPFASLLVEAQNRSPRLREAAAAVQQAVGQALQARARPNPTTSLQVENFAASTPFGRDQGQSTLTVDQPIELGGKRSARIAAGRAGVVAAEARQVQTRADYAFSLADLYAQAEAAERRLTLAREALQLAQDNQRVAQTLLDAGRESRLRVLQVESTVTTATADLEAARIAEVDALSRLTALSGSTVAYTSIGSSLLTAAPTTGPRSAPDPFSTPAVRAAEAERDAASRRVNVERVRAVPDVTASVGFRRFPYDNSTAMVAGVSVPLPLFDQNRGNINSARAELAAAEARLETARLDAQADIRTAVFQIDAAGVRLEAASTAERTATETYQLTRTGYEAGRLQIIDLLNAQRSLVETRARVVDAQLARVRAEADLSRLQGRAPFGG